MCALLFLDPILDLQFSQGCCIIISVPCFICVQTADDLEATGVAPVYEFGEVEGYLESGSTSSGNNNNSSGSGLVEKERVKMKCCFMTMPLLGPCISGLPNLAIHLDGSC